MPDPYVFGADAARDDLRDRRHARPRKSARPDRADAYARAYHAHDDQLGALEAEAAAGHYRAEARKLSAGAWLRALRLMFGPWSDDP